MDRLVLKSNKLHIVILGCPGVGKYTTGEMLSRVLDCPLFDNSKVVNIASLVYDFWTPEYIAYRDELRLSFYSRFLSSRDSGYLISTNVVRTKKNWEYFDSLESLFVRFGWKTHYIVLTASEDELLKRVTGKSRFSKQAITDAEYLKDWLARNPDHSCCDKVNSTFLDITESPVEETVSDIIKALQQYDQ